MSTRRTTRTWKGERLAQLQAVYLAEVTAGGKHGAHSRAGAILGVPPTRVEEVLRRWAPSDFKAAIEQAETAHAAFTLTPAARRETEVEIPRALRENRDLRHRLRHMEAQHETILRRLGLYERLESSPIDIPNWVLDRPTKDTKHHAIPQMLFTDVHWDELVTPAQIDGVNAYNRTIATARVTRAFRRAIKVLDNYVSGVIYDGFKLDLGGDIFSGLIHEELTETNEGTIFESIITVLEVLLPGIRMLAERFGKVDIDAVVGNHGRRTKKPRSKNRVQDNFDWLVYKLIEREFRGDPRITVHVSEAPDAHYQVYNTRYLLTHGDQFRGGSGISGALAPLLLGTARKTRRQVAAGRPHDVMVMGHWHQSIWMPNKGLIVGGCIVGYGEFSYLINAEPEPPQCAMWINTPERGITVQAPVFVADRASEGW